MKNEKWLVILAVLLVTVAVIPFLIEGISATAPAMTIISQSDRVEYPLGTSSAGEVNLSESDDSLAYAQIGSLVGTESGTDSTTDTGATQQPSSAISIRTQEGVSTTASTSETQTTTTSATATTTVSHNKPKSGEMKAVWIPYMSLGSISREKIDGIVAKCKKYGYNTIIFHVRPFGDAMYDSSYFPWSHLVSGKQGINDKGFDPLEYAVEKAHENGLELHAWINPLRIQNNTGKLPSSLAATNPYNVWRSDTDTTNDHYVVDYQEGKYYNPGEETVRKLIVNGIAEIVRNYDVDGIHWDDYFYPASDDSFDDSVSYNAYIASGGKMSLLEWRQDNINKLVKATYAAVKSEDPNCVFGISPAGNIGNCLNAGADVYEWGSESGYVDYLCPQVYWTFDNTVCPYAKTCEKWRALTSSDSVKLYIGLALYKAGGSSDGGKWLKADDILAQQVNYARGSTVDADGFMVYSYEYLEKSQTESEMKNLMKIF